jgi:hypothetical protein
MEEGRREFSESFPCIFPLKQGISAETGSQQTDTTATTLIKTIGYMGSVKSSHISTYIE